MMIVPGCPNAVMMAGGGDPLDEWHRIAAAVRLNATDAAHFSWTNVTPTDQTKWTAVLWLKRTLLAANQCILSGKSGTTTAEVAFDTAEKLTYRGLVDSVGATQGALDSVRVFRDCGGYMPLLLNYDASRAAASRIQAYTEDAEVAFSVTTNIGTCNMNTAGATMRLGRTQYNSNTNYAGFNVAEFYFIDGQTLLPDLFWRKHPRTGQCRPILYAGTYGANGRHYDFIDGTAATAAALGKDRSGNNNDATPNNISVATGAGCDWLEDTATNNFCTLNPLANAQNAPTNGALEVSFGASAVGAIHGTQRISRRFPIYWEVENTSLTAAGVAISVGVCRVETKVSENYELNNVAGIAGFFSSNVTALQKDDGSRPVIGVALSAAGVIHQVAIDGNNGWIGRDDVWFDSAGGTTGNPETGANPTFTLSATHDYVPFVHVYSNTARVNFGQRSFARTKPPRFKTLCTKNLPVIYQVMKPESAFVARIDSGGNIQSALAAAAPWNDWIRIYKSLAAEGWRWQFSDDSANCLESNNTAAKIAFPALGGASYLGYALKLSPANGIVSGRLVHTNGAADVVTDGLSNSRKMVMLRNEAGSNWFVYHPELAAGKLLYLNLQSAETTDASISAVTASGFTVAAALASGTYRWISFAEVEGFLELWKYIANASADGPFHNDSLSPVATWWRDADTGTNNWHTHDTARDPYNQSDRNLIFNLNNAESSQHGMDLVSNGAKLRNSASGSNLSGAKHVGISFGQPFRYANAR